MKKQKKYWGVELSKEEREYWKPKINHIFSLLEDLEGQFPNWVFPLDVYIKNSFYEKSDEIYKKIDLLIGSKLIEKRFNAVSEDIGDKTDLESYKIRITPLGLDFLNNLRTKKINNKMFWLNIILIIFTVIQLTILFLQTI